MEFTKHIAAALMLGMGLATIAQAAVGVLDTTNEVVISDGSAFDEDGDPGNGIVEIRTSTTLKNSKWYNIASRVVVAPGTSLTIEEGTVFGSQNVGGVSGTLVIARGADIYAEGTKDCPIIFTSREDLGCWDTVPVGPLTFDVVDGCKVVTASPSGRNFQSRGPWRPGFAQWGSVAICGRAEIGDNRQNPANPLAKGAFKEAPMEGLPSLPAGANNYGGLNDDDDSGVFTYVSISYGGDDFDPNNNSELNGMSIGGVGRGTTFHHVEILNNIDDGLEVFGGTVNIKCLFVWNIGDDCFDLDQGYRGCVQFVLLVMGAAGPANQGSGFGDNGHETDGFDGLTEGQPVSAYSVYNMTIIGSPQIVPDGEGGFADSADRSIAVRDNNNTQWINCVFMTDGQEVFNNDGDDGDGSTGYGDSIVTAANPVVGDTLNFVERWDTPADWYHVGANGFPNQGGLSDAELAENYQAQDTSLNLLAMCGTVFFDINSYDVLDDAATNNVMPAAAGPGSENAAQDNIESTVSPVVKAERRGEFIVISTDGGLTGDGAHSNITSLDPRAAGDALGENRPLVYQAPANGFYTSPVNFRGAVSGYSDWLQGWTAISFIENGGTDFNPATRGDNETILCSPKTDAAPANVALDLSACISFDSVKGCFYEVVCVDAQDNETVIKVVEGNGTTVFVSDPFNKPLDSSKKYFVRLVGE